MLQKLRILLCQEPIIGEDGVPIFCGTQNLSSDVGVKIINRFHFPSMICISLPPQNTCLVFCFVFRLLLLFFIFGLPALNICRGGDGVKTASAIPCDLQPNTTKTCSKKCFKMYSALLAVGRYFLYCNRKEKCGLENKQDEF